MKLKLPKIVVRNKLLLVASIIVSVVILMVGVYFLVWPRIQSWRDLTKANNLLDERVEKVKSNIATLSQFDSERIEEYDSLLKDLLPEEADTLRVISIVGSALRNSNMALDNFTVDTGAKKATSTIPTASAEVESSPSTITPSSQAKPTTAPKAPASEGFTMTLTAQGEYQSALNFVKALENVRRSIGVTSISITKTTAESLAKVDFSISLALAKPAKIVTPEEEVTLTAENEELLEELLARLIIDSEPSTGPLGKSDPFR